MVLIALIFALFPLIEVFKNRKKKDFNIKDYKYNIIGSSLIFVGCLVRLGWIDKYPAGINQDEASIGYEAYSLLKYGIDRNGMTFPIHFIAWGSGQNALYGYLIMPFIYFLGNTTLALRLTMALFGCLTIAVAYKLFKDFLGKKNGLIALFLLVICPWHIMKSRWGLESNLFPDLVFYACTLIYYSFRNKKKRLWYFANILLGISTYAYGTSYFFVPLFLIILDILLIKKEKIKIKEGIIGFCITGVIALPMILFVIINYFEFDTIKLGITIPRLYFNRFTSITSVNGNILINTVSNFLHTIIIMVTQWDGLLLNGVIGFGTIYYFSIVFVGFGIFYAFKNKYIIVNSLFLAAIGVCLITRPNINRINILWVAFIFYMILGVIYVIKDNIKIKRFVIGFYSVSFILFLISYFTWYQESISFINKEGFKESVEFSETLDYKELYVDNIYIDYLFYSKFDTNRYLEKRKIDNMNVMFQEVTSVGNVKFYLNDMLDEDNVYIMEKDKINNYDNIKDYERKEFGNYVVVWRHS